MSPKTASCCVYFLAVSVLGAHVASASPKAVMLSDVPGGKAHWSALPGALTIVLNHSGVPTDYNTLMGDLGLAFILQASDQVARYNGALDAGWWPLAIECAPVLLQQYAPIAGVEFRWHGGDGNAYKADPGKYYRTHLAAAVKASIDAGRPALANHAWEVVVGYDSAPIPLFSFCPRSRDGKQKIGRPSRYPFAAVTLGARVDRLSRRQADIEALKRAVALGRDAIPMPGGFRTGQKAFALWAEVLRDVEHLGQARWHANVRRHLGLNRRAAVTYLKAMAKRHPKKVAAHLLAAVKLYEQVLAELKKADTSKAAMRSKAGRERLAALAETMASLEQRAVAELQKALTAFAAGRD